MSAPSPGVEPFSTRRGGAPLLLAFPHCGVDLGKDGNIEFISNEVALRDADWLVDDLYAPLADALDATTVAARFSRSVIDPNRDPEDRPLYPGRRDGGGTGLVPETDFDGRPLRRPGACPDAAERARRVRVLHAPYHAAVAAEAARLRAAHGAAVVWDCHSIRSRVPRVFDGELPLLNLGTAGGASCAPALRASLVEGMRASGLDFAADGVFRGGWTTRRHGRPDEGIHAVQMEIAQRAYMDEPAPGESPRGLDRERAEPLRAALRGLLERCLDFASAAAAAPGATAPAAASGARFR